MADLDGDRGGTDAGQFGKEINNRPFDREVRSVILFLIGWLRPKLDLADHARGRVKSRLAAGNPERLDPAESDAMHERDQPPWVLTER